MSTHCLLFPHIGDACCYYVSLSLPSDTTCSLSLSLSLSLSSKSRRYSRSVGWVRDGERGQQTSIAASSKVDASFVLPLGLGAILRAVTTAATLPLILLLRLAHLVNSPCQGGNCPLLFKLFRCSDPLILSVFGDELCSFDVQKLQMAAAAQAWMYI
jgi:hypothetical protein